MLIEQQRMKLLIKHIISIVMEGNEFERKYKQLNMLGKGNYGKVYKVKLNDGKQGKEAKYYVAKKMFLEGLTEQEIKSAFGEIEILEKLSKEISCSEIPFVVSYKEFFRIEHELIIIMEYCECGELSTYLKNLKKNGQRLNEKIIAYWFIQLLFGVKALHSKNILHRDLKSANIFLTKNFSLKIGDFGISKVLEGSSAITCIGTPLYLSPEVCNNQPYGLSSDMWALGCILYEMCTLRYPFEASNMIVLAKKIVMDDVAPLPTYYSKQLNDIVTKMFIKDNKKRITAEQIFKTPYIINAIGSFLQDQGKLEQLAAPIPNELLVVEQKSEASTNQSQVRQEEEETMKTINSVVERTGAKNNQTLNNTKTMSRQERKEEEVRKQFETMKLAARENASKLGLAKQEKQRNLGQTMNSERSTLKKLQIEAYAENKAHSEIKYKAKQMQKMQTINLTAIANTLKNLSIKDAEDFEDVPLPGNSSYIPLKATTKKMPIPKHQYEPEEIAEQIAEEEELEEYYDDDFEEYIEEDPVVREQEKTKEKQNILAYYENQINSINVSPSKREKINNAFKPVGASDVKSKISSRIQECDSLVGHKRYEQLYKLFSTGRINMLKDKAKYENNEKRVLFLIEEIMLFENK